MAMSFLDDDLFNDEEELDLSEVTIENNRASDDLINDPLQSLQLMSKIYSASPQNLGRKLKSDADELFELLSDIPVRNELKSYNEIMFLCDRLREAAMMRALRGKVVVGIGGRFSSGKSNFINSISGIGNTLMTDTNQMTDIPAYILYSWADRYQVSTSNGGMVSLSLTEMQALTKSFSVKYGFGFSSIVESILVCSSKFSLNRKLALLDTPGYSGSRHTSDRNEITDYNKAYEQLKKADYLIWIMPIDPGLVADDIDFIRRLNMKRKILFVLNKADLKSESIRTEILNNTREQIQEAKLPCAGVALYSSSKGKEYTEKPLIQGFFSNAAKLKISDADAFAQLSKQLNILKDNLCAYKYQLENNVKSLRMFVKNSENIKAITAAADIWVNELSEYYRLSDRESEFDRRKNHMTGGSQNEYEQRY